MELCPGPANIRSAEHDDGTNVICSSCPPADPPQPHHRWLLDGCKLLHANNFPASRRKNAEEPLRNQFQTRKDTRFRSEDRPKPQQDDLFSPQGQRAAVDRCLFQIASRGSEPLPAFSTGFQAPLGGATPTARHLAVISLLNSLFELSRSGLPCGCHCSALSAKVRVRRYIISSGCLCPLSFSQI